MNTCLQCTQRFEADKADRKYCSRVCYYASRIGHAPTNPLRRQTNTCTTCGKHFEAGGRSGKHRDSKYCSRECAGVGRIRHPLPRTLSPTDAAYLAGFFDGEGSIIRVKGHGWRITIYQSSEEVIQWIATTTGTGTVASSRTESSNLIKKPKVARTQWYWNLYGRNAFALLEQLLPYLIVKRDRALEAIESQQT